MKRTMFFAAGFLFSVGICAAADGDNAQVNEAAAVFDGVKPSEMRGGTWKVVCSSAEGGEWDLVEKTIENPGRPSLLRLAVRFRAPVKEGTVTWRLAPADP